MERKRRKVPLFVQYFKKAGSLQVFTWFLWIIITKIDIGTFDKQNTLAWWISNSHILNCYFPLLEGIKHLFSMCCFPTLRSLFNLRTWYWTFSKLSFFSNAINLFMLCFTNLNISHVFCVEMTWVYQVEVVEFMSVLVVCSVVVVEVVVVVIFLAKRILTQRWETFKIFNQ